MLLMLCASIVDTMTKMSIKTYSELMRLHTFEDRFNYLSLKGSVGEDTFGFDRYLNQAFYRSAEWKRVRDQVIIRDNGCDMGIEDAPIFGRVYIHHMNPLTREDIINSTDYLLNPEYLICVSHDTHNAIHYGSFDILPSKSFVERSPNDTTPWKK